MVRLDKIRHDLKPSRVYFLLMESITLRVYTF